jgi:hypothetical protein
MLRERIPNLAWAPVKPREWKAYKSMEKEGLLS